jgi:hypothetical protein
VASSASKFPFREGVAAVRRRGSSALWVRPKPNAELPRPLRGHPFTEGELVHAGAWAVRGGGVSASTANSEESYFYGSIP